MQMDTRFGLTLGADQVCGGCVYHDSSNSVDWNTRRDQLKNILDDAKKRAKVNGATHDCVIGVSGGKDSTFITGYIKENFDINVLLVNCTPDELTDTGEFNLRNLQFMGCDMLSFKANPLLMKKLSLYSFEKFGNVCRPFEQLAQSTVARFALSLKIPLIIMGENGALVWGTSYQKADDNWFGAIHTNTNEGILEAKLWEIEGIESDQLNMFRFPKIEDIEQNNIKAIFLQYYVKEYGPVYNADFSLSRGMRGRYDDKLEDIGRYRIFSSLDDDLMMVNEMLKYLKNGFGRASDDVVDDLRNGRINKKEAITLIKKYDGLCGQKYIDNCCRYLGIPEKHFWQVVDRFVNKNLFAKDDKGIWRPKFTVGEDFDY